MSVTSGVRHRRGWRMRRAWRWMHRLNVAPLRKHKKQKPAPKPKPEVLLAQKALKIAASQIGVKEAPANSNNVKYNTWYYGQPVLGANFAWCAVFVSWVLTQAGRPFKESYVPHIVALATNKQAGLAIIPFSRVKATLAAGTPVLACYDWEHNGTADHIGFVEKVISPTSFSAIEGNTGPSNFSNGGEVMRTVRTTNLVQAFVAVAK